jgi:replicative superfamily II helicase
MEEIEPKKFKMTEYVVKDSKSIPVTQLEKEFREIFKFKNFNQVQSQCFNDLCNSDINMVVSAPTGAGKTVRRKFKI